MVHGLGSKIPNVSDIIDETYLKEEVFEITRSENSRKL